MVVEDPMYPICEQSIFNDKLVAACSKPSVNAQIDAPNSKRMRKITPSVFFFLHNEITKPKANRLDKIRTKKRRVNSKIITKIKLPCLYENS